MAFLFVDHCARVAHSPYGRAAYANVNGLDVNPAASGAGTQPNLYNEDDEHEQQHEAFLNPASGHSPTRRIAPPPPSRSETYQPRPPPPVPAEAMASLNIGLDKTGRFFVLHRIMHLLDLFHLCNFVHCIVSLFIPFRTIRLVQTAKSFNEILFLSGVRWRDPDLHEVIAFLNNPNAVVKANAAAYLQHLCYNSDPVKQQTRLLGGIPPLVALISCEQPDVHRNACGALRYYPLIRFRRPFDVLRTVLTAVFFSCRNLSYGRQNDENKRALHKAGGIPSLVRLLIRSPDPDVQELVTGVLWNLSSCEVCSKVT